jgi:hypothetical protein
MLPSSVATEQSHLWLVVYSSSESQLPSSAATNKQLSQWNIHLAVAILEDGRICFYLGSSSTPDTGGVRRRNYGRVKFYPLRCPLSCVDGQEWKEPLFTLRNLALCVVCQRSCFPQASPAFVHLGVFCDSAPLYRYEKQLTPLRTTKIADPRHETPYSSSRASSQSLFLLRNCKHGRWMVDTLSFEIRRACPLVALLWLAVGLPQVLYTAFSFYYSAWLTNIARAMHDNHDCSSSLRPI